MTAKPFPGVNRKIARTALFGACFAFAQAVPPALADIIDSGRIERITLSSGGLAEVRRSARIDGDGTLRIDIPLDQVDDFLKSLVVSDPAGTIDAVTLDGLSPVEETFRRLPSAPVKWAPCRRWPLRFKASPCAPPRADAPSKA
ncbi:hypothetical protein [Nitratireductor aquibiodomus]|uniref:hypothetical protein n=1 Tax=Nitratireductor aquibiodomus TaxID=204799 RepID=UPI0002D2B4A7|nr:hypothetical protein [Nitratireductor aquibiodomus]